MLPTGHSLVCVYADDVMVFAWMQIEKGASLKTFLRATSAGGIQSYVTCVVLLYQQKAFCGYSPLTLLSITASCASVKL